MRADRLVSIVLLLQANGRMTAGDLAEELEVSLRTVHRDLEALSMAGVPVVIDRGRTGGASLLDGYRTDLTGLNEPELRVLLSLGAGSVASDLGLRGVLDSATRKLTVAAGSGRALSLQQQVLIDGDTWARNRVVPEQLVRVQDALWSDRRLRLRYRRREEHVVERVVEPYGLVSKRGTWYLLAAAGGTRRVYRVSRIENAEVLPERFERPPDFDLEAAWAKSVSSYRDHDVLRVCARVKPQAQVRFARVCGDWVVARRPDGVWEVDMPNLEAAAGYIAVFGDDIEVLSPEALRQILANIGGQLVATYRPAHCEFSVQIVTALVNPIGPAPEHERVKRKQLLRGRLAAGETLQVDLSPEVQLGNSGGLITLFDKQGLKVHGVSYTAAQAQREGWTIAF